jgi:mxaJ protein
MGRKTAMLILGALLASAVPLAAQEARDTGRGSMPPSAIAVRGLATNEEGQPPRLPAMPEGMTLDLIRAGDSLFHGKGHCFACHGADATGLPDAGSALTIGLNFVPLEWRPIDSLITAGIADAITRSAIQMPPRGGKSDLSPDETRAIAAYVWAISQTRGEPWPGGHATHAAMVPPGSTAGTAVRRSGGQWLTAGVALGALALGTPADRLHARPPDRPSVLRVCSDPNNLPFSNRKGEGFENRIAELIAGGLHAPVRYYWWPQRRGFVRNTLGAGRCDLVVGIPASDGQVLATRPYYTSTYVFLSRRSSGLRIRSLDDPRLRRLRIGLHFIGDDYHNTPAAAALARRGIVRNLVGYSIYGDYSRPNPPARLVDAVARGEVDVAIVWGPFAGYFGPRTGVPLVSTPVTPALDGPVLPFTFAIAAGVRQGDTALQARVDRALESARPQIRAVLERYGVPLVPAAGASE